MNLELRFRLPKMMRVNAKKKNCIKLLDDTNTNHLFLVPDSFAYNILPENSNCRHK